MAKLTKKDIKKIETQVEDAAEKWREVIEVYLDLQEKHKVFCTAALQFHLDFAGPGLSEAMQRLYHKRNFTIFLEDLMYEDHRKGGVSQLLPPKSSSAKKQPKFAETEE
jgi:hypothetical protein